MMTTTPSKNVPREITMHLTTARENLATANEHLAALEAQVARLARGTREVPKPAPTARPLPEATLPQKIETVLRSSVASSAELAAAFAVPEGRVVAAIKGLGTKVADVSSDGNPPRFSFVVGDAGPTPELNELVERLIAVRPMTSADLIAFTGAREKRISGAIVRIQRDPALEKRLVNKGTPARALWYLRSTAKK